MKRLKNLRISRNLKQSEMASFLGIERTTYVKYESGINEPNKRTLIRLADYFNVSVDYLIERTDNPFHTSDTCMTTLVGHFNEQEFALWNELHDLDDQEKQEVLDFIKFKKSKKKQ